jgi:hypothetical protein
MSAATSTALTDFAEFAIVLSRELGKPGVYPVADAAVRLRWHARRIHACQEVCCNRGNEEDDRRLERAMARATKYIRELGLSASVGGDVRGPAIIIHTPRSNCSNAWGDPRGWVVPR